MTSWIRPIALLGLASCVLAGCATFRASCYPHVYLDSKYAIQGTYGGTDPSARSPACYQFVKNPEGRILRIDYRQDGEIIRDPLFGVATIVIDYAPGSEKRNYLDTNGAPISNLDGVYAVRLQHDERGHATEWRNLGAGDQLIEARGSGVAIIRWQYDDKGNTVEERYLGADGQPKEDQRRGVATVRWQYAGGGPTLEERYFGADGQLKEDRFRGVAIVRWRYDRRGPVVEERYYGADDKLREDRPRGVAVIRWQYDRNGNPVEEQYLGADEQPKEDRRRGVAMVRWQYDSYGRRVTTLMYDSKGNLIRESR